MRVVRGTLPAQPRSLNFAYARSSEEYSAPVDLCSLHQCDDSEHSMSVFGHICFTLQEKLSSSRCRFCFYFVHPLHGRKLPPESSAAPRTARRSCDLPACHTCPRWLLQLPGRWSRWCRWLTQVETNNRLYIQYVYTILYRIYNIH